MKKETWFYNLGFKDNPFSIKPSAFNDKIEGNDEFIKEINDKIYNSELLLIYGPYGSGKTSILKKIIKEFRGKRQLIYYNCSQSEAPIDFDKLLYSAGGFLRKIFRIKKKNMVLLLDEASNMNSKDILLVKKYHDEGFFKSVVFVSKLEDLRFIKEINDVVRNNKFMVKDIEKEHAISLIRKRIGYIPFLPDDIIGIIFEKNKNPRIFLRNCEDVCKHAFDKNADQVAEEHVEEVLG